MIYTPPARSSLTLLATLVPTVAANLDALNVFSSDYDDYLICIDGIKPGVTDTLAVRLAVAGAADAGANYYTTAFGTVDSAAAAVWLLTAATLAAGLGLTGQLSMQNANDATLAKNLTLISTTMDAAARSVPMGIAGHYIGANAVTGIRFYWNGGNNFSAVGKIRIYGLGSS